MSNSSAQSTQSTSENYNDVQNSNNNNNNRVEMHNTLPTPLPPPSVVRRVTRTPTEAIVGKLKN